MTFSGKYGCTADVTDATPIALQACSGHHSKNNNGIEAISTQTQNAGISTGRDNSGRGV
ncbi:MAG: hypothetical protein ABL857_04270 [Rickettsiales bacterium]|jgi:hypothetical protein